MNKSLFMSQKPMTPMPQSPSESASSNVYSGSIPPPAKTPSPVPGSSFGSSAGSVPNPHHQSAAHGQHHQQQSSSAVTPGIQAILEAEKIASLKIEEARQCTIIL